MTYPVRRRLHAQEKLEELVDRIAAEDPAAAVRFVEALEGSLALLAEMPEAGPRHETPKPRLAALRKWVIPRYPRYLLFYLFEGNAVHLIDVVDGRTDYDVEDNP